MAQWYPGILMTGRLLYLMGASGSGKDTILQGVEDRLGSSVHIAARVITRPCTPTERRAISVTRAQFEAMHTGGQFAMAWQANGLSYGILRDICQYLVRGHDVIVNGSRAYLHQAAQDFPTLQPIMLHVDATILKQRLTQRQRESGPQIQDRLARNDRFADLCARHTGNPVIGIDNSGHAGHAITTLCEILERRQYNPEKHPLFAQDRA